jgi:hypothetical protein
MTQSARDRREPTGSLQAVLDWHARHICTPAGLKHLFKTRLLHSKLDKACGV